MGQFTARCVQYLWAVLLVAIICIQSCSAIQCYECNSAFDKRCLGDANNKLSDDLKKPCPDRQGDVPYSFCRKVKQVIDFEVNGLTPDSRVIRSCGYQEDPHGHRCYQRSGFGGRQEVCSCAGDGCNSSSALYASTTLLLVGGGAIVLRQLRWL